MTKQPLRIQAHTMAFVSKAVLEEVQRVVDSM